jgi:predicted phosphodiesterase
MALYGIVSDIHGNLDAFCAAVGFVVEHGVERIYCLGDIVGYNADPNACVSMVRALSIDCVAGNHDLIAIRALGFERCAPKPAHALRRTRRVIDEVSRRDLAALPSRRLVEDDIVLVHGGFDDVCQYVTTPRRVEENYVKMTQAIPRATICFFGHTHVQKVYEVHKGVGREIGIAQHGARSAEVPLSGPGRAFFINPGSIDAARKDDDKLAELAIFDSCRRVVTFHRIPYDHMSVEQRAVDDGYRMTPNEVWMQRLGSIVARTKRNVLSVLGAGS